MCTTDRHDGSCPTCETDTWIVPRDTQDRRAGLTPAPGTICPRCGVNLVTGKPTPNCATHGQEAHDVWCADENYADDPCATCNPKEDDPMTDRDRRAEAELYFDEAESVESHKESAALSSAGALSALLAIKRLLAEIRDRLPEPEGVRDEPVDVTEEPPVGSQVTDREGDVWERREEGWTLWWAERIGWLADLYGDLDPWPDVRDLAPLRPTTDEDRKRVGLPVEPDPADVDPDEALARVLYETECEVRWEGAGAVARDTYRDLARAAREHIFEEQAAARYEERITQVKSEYHDYTQRAEKAETDLARVTKERDEWKSRHAALRAGVERVRRNRTTLTDVLMCIADVLDLDNAYERTEPAP